MFKQKITSSICAIVMCSFGFSASAFAAESVTVYAAASLTNAINDLDALYEQKQKTQVKTSYAGSSTLELIEYLDQKEAHYITNGLMQAQQLTLKGFHVVCLGGEVRNITGACVGANTMKSLSRYHFSKGFFGTNGIDLMNGFTTPDSEEAAIKELAMERCQMSYVLSDHSKFNKVYHVTFGQINDAVIITDHCEKEIKEQATVVEVRD